MPSVLLLTRYARRGPSSRVRHFDYVPELERAGFQVIAAPFLPDAYLERLFLKQPRSLRMLAGAYWRRLRWLMGAGRYDLIWIEKEALPWVPANMERFLLGRTPLVIDFDDPWNLRYAQHPNALVRRLMGRKLEALVGGSACATVGSEGLALWLKSAGCPKVIEIPSAVDIERYPSRPLPAGPFTIGWIGTPGNERYLDLVAEPLRVLCQRWGARLRMIGGGWGYSLRGVAIDYVRWNEATQAEELARCHVGIMPLSDGPWERGKCGYKLIQYMAVGRPVVASPVGPAQSIILPGRTGLLAATDAEWIEALSGLAADPERANALGEAGRQRAEALYSLEFNAPALIALFRRVLAEQEEGRKTSTTDSFIGGNTRSTL